MTTEERIADLEAEEGDLLWLCRGLSHNDIEAKIQHRLIDIRDELRQLRGG